MCHFSSARHKYNTAGRSDMMHGAIHINISALQQQRKYQRACNSAVAGRVVTANKYFFQLAARLPAPDSINNYPLDRQSLTRPNGVQSSTGYYFPLSRSFPRPPQLSPYFNDIPSARARARPPYAQTFVSSHLCARGGKTTRLVGYACVN